MVYLKNVMRVSLACAISIGAACSGTEDHEKTPQEIEDRAREVAGETADKTREIAGEIADRGKEIVSATGEVITDGWITAKISAKFADDKLLKEAGIHIDTKSRVVTLKGAVPSAAARTRAMTIAGGTEGVDRVIDEMTLKTN